MAIILSHSSALAFWTNVRIGRSRAFYEGCKIVPACSSPLPSTRATQKELARLAMVFKPSALDALALRDDMHVLVKQGRHNDKVRGIRAHSTTHDFSSRVFFPDRTRCIRSLSSALLLSDGRDARSCGYDSAWRRTVRKIRRATG